MSDVDGFVRKIFGKSDEWWDRQSRIVRLATYNAEKTRGLVHTAEWRSFMGREQEWFDREEALERVD